MAASPPGNIHLVAGARSRALASGAFQSGSAHTGKYLCALTWWRPLFFFYIILIFCVIDLPADTYGVLHGLAVVFCVVRWRWFVSETFFFFACLVPLIAAVGSVCSDLLASSPVATCRRRLWCCSFFLEEKKNLSTRHTRNRKQTQTRVGFFLFFFGAQRVHDVSHVATFCVNTTF